MNKEDRLRKNRRRYREGFGLGLFRGKGLLSVIIWAIYRFVRGPESEKSKKKKKDKDPASFEIID